MDTALPVTHKRNIVVAKLTCPEELERHLSGTACIIHTTWSCCPVAALIKVKTCVGVDEVFAKKYTILWKDVCVLYFMQVGDTTLTLIKLVVPRDCSAGDKTLCHKSEILLKGEVGKHTCYGLLFVT